MTGEVIKSFLVGLGFGVDDGELAKFNKAIASATLKVAGLFAAVEATASGIAYSIKGISNDFEKIGYEYKILAPAINKALVLRREMLHAYSSTGINLTRTVQEAQRLNISFTKTQYILEALYKSVAARFFPLLTKQSDLLRKKIYDNLPKLQRYLEQFIKIVFKAFGMTVQLGQRLWSILGRVYDFLVMLDKATDGWSTKILAAVAAWKYLNLAFLATPLGMVLTGLLAILALYDDFKVWQEGGKSFFNWGPVVPIINAVTYAFTALWNMIKNIVGGLADLLHSFQALHNLDMKSFWEAMRGLGGKLFFNVPDNVSSNLNTFPNGIPPSAPISNSTRHGNNYYVDQQTGITIVGTANAEQMNQASALSSQSAKDTGAMVRNMRGATTP